MDDDRTSRGAESYIFGAEDNALVKLAIDMSESNGYALGKYQECIQYKTSFFLKQLRNCTKGTSASSASSDSP